MPRVLSFALLLWLSTCSVMAMNVVSATRVEVGDCLMVPLRGVLERLGFEVTYERVMGDALVGVRPTDAAPQSDVTFVELVVGSTTARVWREGDAEEEGMAVAPTVFGSRVFVPLRFVAETFGYDVEYHGSYVDFIWGDNVAVRLKLERQGSGGGAKGSSGPRPSGQLAPWTASQKAEDSLLGGYTNWELTVVRNEIYARHGRTFDNPHLRRHFTRQGWYHPRTGYSEGRLNSTERFNADYIRQFQTNLFGKPATAP